jgi:NAD(P)-dependent dehydrogenase (short-subunit alcohol dehydrogenase family)
MTDMVAGKVFVITGASSGLGRQRPRLLGAKGANVVVGARWADLHISKQASVITSPCCWKSTSRF